MGNTTHKLDQTWQAIFKDKWRKAVLYDHSLTMGNKAVAVATLEDYNREDPKQVGTTFNKAQTLAEKLGCNEKLVRDSWKALRDAGYLHSLGRSSGGRGVYIHRFDLPSEIRPDKTSGQSGQKVRTDRTKGPMEQEEHNKENITNRISYISSPQADEPDSSFNDPQESTTEDDPVAIDFFTETEEPQRRDEFINYWATVATAHDNPHTYSTVLDLFIKDMAGKNRSNWGGTFMSAMKTYLEPGDVHEFGLDDPEALDEIPAPEFAANDLQGAWAGNDDRPEEFRKAWERASLAGHEPIHIIAVGASDHVRAKYPRELLDVLNTMKKIDRAKAVGKYRRATISK